MNSLKGICNCPLCYHNYLINADKATYNEIANVAFYCLSKMYPDKKYFELSSIYTFITNHFLYFMQNKRFTKKERYWKKSLASLLSHSSDYERLFSQGINGFWKPLNLFDPWDLKDVRNRKRIMCTDCSNYLQRVNKKELISYTPINAQQSVSSNTLIGDDTSSQSTMRFNTFISPS